MLKVVGLKLIKNNILIQQLLVLLLTLLIQMCLKTAGMEFPMLLAGSLLVLQFL